MSQKTQKTENTSQETQLMKRILEVRYTDIEEEKRLCKQLLDLSEKECFVYGNAFANVYLVDSHLALGEYNSCGFYLMRARILCEEYGFDDLMITLHNCSGLYYQKLNEDQTAIYHFLEGKKLAKKLSDINMLAKFYNNIGYCIACREDFELAKTYFRLAFETIEPLLDENNRWRAVSYLSNLAEVCRYLGDANETKEILQKCEELSEDNIYTRIRLGCGWTAYYLQMGEKDQCNQIVDRLLEADLKGVEDQFFLCEMVEGLCDIMMALGEKMRAKQLLDMVLDLKYDSSIGVHYRVLSLQIQYGEEYEEHKQLEEAYKEYYEIVKQIAQSEDETCAQSMTSKLQIYEATVERERMIKQKEVLENASQLDELTGVYNRRYFNKLVSKMIQKEDAHMLGIIMLDVDYFKQYNDFYGHFKGDHALRVVSKALVTNKIDGLYVSRYGGDEFVCLCVNLTNEQMEAYTSNVINQLREQKVPHEKNPSAGILTVSIGYCNETFEQGRESEELIKLADEALYITKNAGRNGVTYKHLCLY